MQALAQRAGVARPLAPGAPSTRRTACAATPSTSGPQVGELYIGFVKEDGFGSREGRKGRVIKDDIRKYPSRDAWGTGGWAGGEAGLWQLREEAQKELAKKKKAVTPVTGPASAYIPKATAGKKPIYVGFSKDELELRKSGAKGRVIVDDPKKYPGKEDIGPMMGAIGGFAGGEAGLKQFVKTGTLKLRGPNEPGPKQFSPLTIAGGIALAGAVGGIVLQFVSDAGEQAVSTQVLQAPIDDHTKYLILASLALVGASAAIVGAAAAVRTVQEQLQETAKNAAVSAGFLALFFLATKAVLDS